MYRLAFQFAGCMWIEAVSGKKKLQIQEYPDTCGRSLRFEDTCMFCRPVSMTRFLLYTEMFYLLLTCTPCNNPTRHRRRSKGAISECKATSDHLFYCVKIL